MQLTHLWMHDFRSYVEAELVPATEGLTVVVGPNGAGKTNLLEAVGYLSTLRSFRGAPSDALVRSGAGQAVVRAEGRRQGHQLLVEAEIRRAGRDRAQVNRQPLRRAQDLLGALQVTVFTPDDLALVKGGPQDRRDYLDDLLVALHPRHQANRAEVERVLRQRGALLRQAQGQSRPAPPLLSTLDVWDAKLAAAGEALVRAREGLVTALGPPAGEAYRRLAHRRPAGNSLALRYWRSWTGPLADALARARGDDLRRGVTTTGPHRDDVVVEVAGLPARTQASQGEQRSAALALRLAGHDVVGNRLGSAPVLLLDDVFSELDGDRAAALVALLPAGQAILTTAGTLPAGAEAAATVRVGDGRIV